MYENCMENVWKMWENVWNLLVVQDVGKCEKKYEGCMKTSEFYCLQDVGKYTENTIYHSFVMVIWVVCSTDAVWLSY